MNTFKNLYGITILQLVLRHSENFSKTLQNSFLASCWGKEIADLTLQTINSLQSENELELLSQKTVQQAEVLQVTQHLFHANKKNLLNFSMRTKRLYTMRFLMQRHFIDALILTL